MQFSEAESKEGFYEVYYNEAGERLVVLEGLSVEDQQQLHAIQDFIHTHYDVISLFYWVLFGTVLVYLVGVNIVVPLFGKRKVKNTS